MISKNEATKDEFETDKLYIYGSDIPEKPILIEGHGHNPVIKIVCGKYHSIILLAGNMLRGIGSNDMGQLGLPLETEKVIVDGLMTMMTIINLQTKIILVTLIIFHIKAIMPLHSLKNKILVILIIHIINKGIIITNQVIVEVFQKIQDLLWKKN